MYSKNWQNRREALKEIKSALLNKSTKYIPQSLLVTALPAIVKGLSDKLFNVAHFEMFNYKIKFRCMLKL